jgi:hypothetical protein
MFAALIRAAESWRGLRFTLRQLDALRKDLDAKYEARSPDQTGHLGREFPGKPAP